MDSIADRKPIVQVLSTGEKHFVTIHYDFSKVTLYDSLGIRPTKKLREQVLALFSVDGKAPQVVIPKVHKQAYRSNNCAVFAAAFMADICFGKSVLGAIYVDSQSQRNWLLDVLQSGRLIPCSHLVEKPSRFAETNPPDCKLQVSVSNMIKI